MKLQIFLKQNHLGIKSKVFVQDETLYFYNLNVNSYLNEFLQEIHAKFAWLYKFFLVLA